MVQNLRKTDSATAARGFAYQIVSYVAPIEAAKNILQGKCARHPQAWGRCAPASTSAMNQLSNDGQDLDDTSFQTGQIAGDIAVLTFAIVAFPGAGIGGPARAGNIAKTARAAKTVHASKTLATTARQTKAANSGAQSGACAPAGWCNPDATWTRTHRISTLGDQWVLGRREICDRNECPVATIHDRRCCTQRCASPQHWWSSWDDLRARSGSDHRYQWLRHVYLSIARRRSPRWTRSNRVSNIGVQHDQARCCPCL